MVRFRNSQYSRISSRSSRDSAVAANSSPEVSWHRATNAAMSPQPPSEPSGISSVSGNFRSREDFASVRAFRRRREAESGTSQETHLKSESFFPASSSSVF